MIPNTETKSRRLSILLVLDEDDYAMIRDLLFEIEGVRFDLEWAGTYEAALEAIKRDRCDVCLFDHHLGERSGLDLLREALGEGYRAPVIMFNGRGDHEVDLEAMEAGAADYLAKRRAADRVLRARPSRFPPDLRAGNFAVPTRVAPAGRLGSQPRKRKPAAGFDEKEEYAHHGRRIIFVGQTYLGTWQSGRMRWS